MKIFKLTCLPSFTLLIITFSTLSLNLVKTYKTGTGGFEYVLEDLGLKSGIYLIRISSAGIDSGFKKLIVSDK